MKVAEQTQEQLSERKGGARLLAEAWSKVLAGNSFGTQIIQLNLIETGSDSAISGAECVEAYKHAGQTETSS